MNDSLTLAALRSLSSLKTVVKFSEIDKLILKGKRQTMPSMALRLSRILRAKRNARELKVYVYVNFGGVKSEAYVPDANGAAQFSDTHIGQTDGISCAIDGYI